MRSSIIVAFVTLGLITPACAQEIDQSTRQQIERIAAAYVENWNKHNAAGVAALYTKDGVQVTATGVKSGPQEIEQAYESAIKTFPQHNGQTIEQISPLGKRRRYPNWPVPPRRPGAERPHQARRALYCGRCTRRRDMENPDSDGYSDAASRTGCGEVGVPEILSGRELGGGWARRPASGVPAHICGSDATLGRGDSKP